MIEIETHQEVFGWVLKELAKGGLLDGKTLGIDASTLEANAALRSIVRRDTGESYYDFLERLAKESGIETPTREDLAKLDRKRKGKGKGSTRTRTRHLNSGVSGQRTMTDCCERLGLRYGAQYGMRRTTVNFPEALKRDLELVARAEERSEAQLIRAEHVPG